MKIYTSFVTRGIVVLFLFIDYRFTRILIFVKSSGYAQKSIKEICLNLFLLKRVVKILKVKCRSLNIEEYVPI